ncbi:MAG: proline--tRNA ligase [Proteobacteria bacterium]|nr:proline--tRNA ligase [Pseudomonadota bacterium]
MRYSQTLIPTRKETPVDAELPSHRLMLRAGYIEQLTAGVYTLLPLANRSVQKICQIVREELNAAGAQEILLPMVQPAEIWKQSGRWDHYGKELLRFKDRKDQEFCLSPTHEEGVTDLARRHIRSYRDMPQNLYQIQVKFRDELRPRGGLMRGREFMMKDGYSFDVSFEAAEESYQKMYQAYSRIFKRCGLSFRAVEADSGNIGGSHSHEFQVLAQTGEDRILSCPKCGYAANEEKAEVKRTVSMTKFEIDANTPAREEVHTPGQHSIDEVAAFLKIKPEQSIKTLVYLADAKPVVVLLRGNENLNEIKLTRVLGCETLVMASDTAIQEVMGAEVGSLGPCGVKIPVYADLNVATMHDCVCGANHTDYHFIHIEPGRDFQVTAIEDLVLAEEGDACPHCGESLQAFKGIEVGHVFLLGTKYSDPMGATYLDAAGDSHPCVMGCYGIGITRVLAAAIEQYNDENGINLPTVIAPFHVIIAPMLMKNETVVAAAEKIYAELEAAGIECLYDDRDVRAGVKFKDDDLLGVPYRITIGERNLKEGMVEFKHRADADNTKVSVDEIVEFVKQKVLADLQAVRS